MLYSGLPDSRRTSEAVIALLADPRCQNPWAAADGKKKATKLDTVPDELLDITVLRDTDDIRRLLPFMAGDKVTAKEISSALGLRKIPLWRAIKFLCLTEVLVPGEKKGNSIIDEVTAENKL